MSNNNFEIWKVVPGFPGYEVSDQGRVRSYWHKAPPTGQGYRAGWKINAAPQKILKTGLTADGYPSVTLSKNGKTKRLRVHQLVLTTFVGPCPPGMESCHNDGVPGNIGLNNLRWDTPSSNAHDKRKHGTIPIGENASRSKLTATQVVEIRRLAAAGCGQRALGRMFSVSHSAIQYIIYRRGWTHV